MMVKKAISCSRRYLMNLALTNYNNLLSLKAYQAPEERKNDSKGLAFVTGIKQELSDLKKEKEVSLISDIKTE